MKSSVKPVRGTKNGTFVNEPSWIDSFCEERESDVLSLLLNFYYSAPGAISPYNLEEDGAMATFYRWFCYCAVIFVASVTMKIIAHL